jgi:hypothetical protein
MSKVWERVHIDELTLSNSGPKESSNEHIRLENFSYIVVKRAVFYFQVPTGFQGTELCTLINRLQRIPAKMHPLHLNELLGRAIAQAVSRRLPTAAARVQTRVWSCGIL